MAHWVSPGQRLRFGGDRGTYDVLAMRPLTPAHPSTPRGGRHGRWVRATSAIAHWVSLCQSRRFGGDRGTFDVLAAGPLTPHTLPLTVAGAAVDGPERACSPSTGGCRSRPPAMAHSVSLGQRRRFGGDRGTFDVLARGALTPHALPLIAAGAAVDGSGRNSPPSTGRCRPRFHDAPKIWKIRPRLYRSRCQRIVFYFDTCF